MNCFKLKFAIAALAVAFFSAPSTVEAQNYTRTGAVAGAVIGAIAGARNDRALGGAAIGGLVGGVAGNAIDRSRSYGYGYGNGYGGNSYRGNVYGGYGRVAPVGSYGGGGYGRVAYPTRSSYRPPSYGSARGGAYCPIRGY